jgi:hypothetical protein
MSVSSRTVRQPAAEQASSNRGLKIFRADDAGQRVETWKQIKRSIDEDGRTIAIVIVNSIIVIVQLMKLMSLFVRYDDTVFVMFVMFGLFVAFVLSCGGSVYTISHCSILLMI